MNKRNIIIICSITIIAIISAIYIVTSEVSSDPLLHEKPSETEGLSIVPTMQDEITSDSAWVGTFQLVWNDLMNEVVKKDIIFDPQEIMATNLNKQEFTTDMISDPYYYKKFGLKTLELKKEIEKGIKEKFDQKSDILDLFDWSDEGLNDPDNPNMDRYFFYVMLYRNFEYKKAFNKLEKGMFGKYSDTDYFGIDDNSTYEVKEQIEVLYYNFEDDFAILINTKTNDEVIFYKNPKGNTFKEIYESMNMEAKNYKGSKVFNSIDNFKAPNIEFNELREYDEFANKPFLTAAGKEVEIVKAVQTIKFRLNEKGGEIKSEAAIDAKATSAMPDIDKIRNFYVNDTFAIFLREKGKDIPYFASRIEDITKFQ